MTANLGARFHDVAAARSDDVALVVAGPRGEAHETTFGELDRWSDAYARGMLDAGLRPGDRLLLLARAGPDFVALAFGALKAGLSIVLVDPGMSRTAFLRCVQRAAPRGLVGIPPVHLLALGWPRAFASVQARWLAGWPRLPGAVERLRARAAGPVSYAPLADDAAAAIVFTTGSTGVPKGVVYTHGVYGAQLELLRRQFTFGADDVVLAGYLPFALLCLCLGMRCVLPHVHPSRPGSVNPGPVYDLARRYQPTIGLGSPAFWHRVALDGVRTGARLDTLRLLLMFGAEVHEPVLRAVRAVLRSDAIVQTPYGSTEAQPLCSTDDHELLEPLLLDQRSTRGVLVGRPLDGVELQLVPVGDAPMMSADAVRAGDVGEVVVRGPMVTAGYFDDPDQDRLHKIGTPPDAWHRMGDCGTLDDEGRLWLAGRRSQRVQTEDGTFFPLPVEARVNRVAGVRRSALVGLGRAGAQRPVVVVEGDGSVPLDRALAEAVVLALNGAPTTAAIRDVLVHPALPMDYRHNAKIQREALARWAAAQLGVAVQ
jgi:olefin beta-lactone synthetase